jgi:molybdopterin-synthase adenylyltransferase
LKSEDVKRVYFLDKKFHNQFVMLNHDKGHLDTGGLARYVRQIIIPGIGREGQEKLRASHVLVAGIGGLGSLSSLYLCAAGIGHLTIIDSGSVQMSDLNRQIIYSETDIGERKAFVAKRRLSETNSDVEISPIALEIGEENVSELIRGVDVVVDGTDSFRTRVVLNAACVREKLPYVYGGISGLKGTATTIIPGQTPCLECFLTHKEATDSPIPVIGPIVGSIAAIQVMEVFKLILHLGDLLAGILLVFDGRKMTFGKFEIKRKQNCGVCSGV